jgi:hypothetical protein
MPSHHDRSYLDDDPGLRPLTTAGIPPTQWVGGIPALRPGWKSLLWLMLAGW